MEAILLAGGFGTRLRSVCPDLPKPMADVGGKPFLYHLMEYWKGQGVTHFILSVGYLADKISSYFGNQFQTIPLDYSVETDPLGTGGGLLHALPYLRSAVHPFLAINGDTLFRVPLQQFVANGDATLALRHVKTNGRYNGVTQTREGLILELNTSSTLINGGVYLFYEKALRSFLCEQNHTRNATAISLEDEILHYFIQKGTCYGQCFDQFFIDIGIPEDYVRCQAMWKKRDYSNHCVSTRHK